MPAAIALSMTIRVRPNEMEMTDGLLTVSIAA